MYLRTPKRYQRGHRRSIISLRWWWLWLLTPIVVAGGWWIYTNREAYIPQVQVLMSDVMGQAQDSLATAMAPTPLPTENPTIRLAAADGAWERGAIEEAVTIYSDLLPLMPNDVEVHYRATLGLIMSGQFEQAVAMAERTVTADPYNPDAWAIRAMALDWNGDYGLAVASAQRALELAGTENVAAKARAEAFLAEAFFDLEQYERALTTVNRAVETDPNSFEALRNRARIVQNTQFDFDAALDDLQAARSLAPNLPYITVDLALVESREGNTDAAIEMLTEIVDLNPGNTRALFWLGWQYLNVVGDPSQAADYLARCVEANPANISCHYILGRSQVRTEQYAAAAESFNKAIDLGSQDPYHYWWAGRAQVLLGSCPAAAPFLQTGYQIALRNEDEPLINDYEDQMRSCRLLAAEPEATEEATAEPNA
jgi:tetratricopeptide (TPR) repeat protein